MPFWSPRTKVYLCGLAFWSLHSPLRYGLKCKGLKWEYFQWKKPFAALLWISSPNKKYPIILSVYFMRRAKLSMASCVFIVLQFYNDLTRRQVNALKWMYVIHSTFVKLSTRLSEVQRRPWTALVLDIWPSHGLTSWNRRFWKNQTEKRPNLRNYLSGNWQYLNVRPPRTPEKSDGRRLSRPRSPRLLIKLCSFRSSCRSSSWTFSSF